MIIQFSEAIPKQDTYRRRLGDMHMLELFGIIGTIILFLYLSDKRSSSKSTSKQNAVQSNAENLESFKTHIKQDFELPKQYIKPQPLYINHCWRCKGMINSIVDKQCPDCGWYICRQCGSCKRICIRTAQTPRQTSITVFGEKNPENKDNSNWLYDYQPQYPSELKQNKQHD